VVGSGGQLITTTTGTYRSAPSPPFCSKSLSEKLTRGAAMVLSPGEGMSLLSCRRDGRAAVVEGKKKAVRVWTELRIKRTG
jgi:hypothetical protein